MRVFEIKSSETDWLCGPNLLTALNAYLNDGGITLDEFGEDDEIREVPPSEWSEIIIHSEDFEKEETLKEFMDRSPKAGMIASTAY